MGVRESLMTSWRLVRLGPARLGSARLGAALQECRSARVTAAGRTRYLRPATCHKDARPAPTGRSSRHMGNPPAGQPDQTTTGYRWYGGIPARRLGEDLRRLRGCAAA